MGPMLRLVVFTTLMLCAACTEADREPIFSTRRAPLVGVCDPQVGYPPPEQRKGCTGVGINTGGK
jgi:hypothetical protein